jgi:hypothetical protein
MTELAELAARVDALANILLAVVDKVVSMEPLLVGTAEAVSAAQENGVI